MKDYSIGNLARQVGLSAKTIRFYEDAGVITKAGRQSNGYRRYPASAVDELKVVKYGRDLGLPLKEIKKLLYGCCQGSRCTHPAGYLKKYLADYSALIEKRIQEMTVLKNKLNELNQNIDSHVCQESDTFCCNIFYQVISSMQKKGGETNV